MVSTSASSPPSIAPELSLPSSSSSSFLSQAQASVLVGTVVTTSIISTICAVCVLYMTSRHGKLRQKQNRYHRLAFGLSLSDLMFVAPMIVNPFLLPYHYDETEVIWKENDTGGSPSQQQPPPPPSWPWISKKYGSQQACTTVGFFTVVGVLLPAFYHLFLSFHFFLIIRGDHRLSSPTTPSSTIDAAATATSTPSTSTSSGFFFGGPTSTIFFTATNHTTTTPSSAFTTPTAAATTTSSRLLRRCSSWSCWYNWNDSRRWRVKEALLTHGIAWSISLCIGIAGLVTQSYNPYEYVCSLSEFPLGCLDQYKDDGIGGDHVDDGDAEYDSASHESSCERGEANVNIAAVLVCILFTLVVLSSLATLAVYRGVKIRYKARQRYRDRISQFRQASSGVIARRSENHRHATFLQEASKQAFLYLIAYLNCFLAPALLFALLSFMGSGSVGSSMGNADIFMLHEALMILFPLQGLWNCFIYVRPRYNGWKQYYLLLLTCNDGGSGNPNGPHDGGNEYDSLSNRPDKLSYRQLRSILCLVLDGQSPPQRYEMRERRRTSQRFHQQRRRSSYSLSGSQIHNTANQSSQLRLQELSETGNIENDDDDNGVDSVRHFSLSLSPQQIEQPSKPASMTTPASVELEEEDNELSPPPTGEQFARRIGLEPSTDFEEEVEEEEDDRECAKMLVRSTTEDDGSADNTGNDADEQQHEIPSLSMY